MRLHKLAAHTRTDLKARLIWLFKYHKRVLLAPVAACARNVLRDIALDHETEIISIRLFIDLIHMFFSYRATQNISKIMQSKKWPFASCYRNSL
jgi:putative transposase